MGEDYRAILTEVSAVARDAGALTLEHFRQFRDLEVGIKGPADFVSDADRQSEQLIRKALLSRWPDWSFTGEEFPPVEGADREHRWLVDPIDGTTNFINGQHYVISIALRRGSETVCGVLYNPVADEMFTAVRGEGAFLNGDRLQVSQREDVGLMAVGTSIPTNNRFTYDGFYDRLEQIRRPIGSFTTVGSSANSCAYVACCRLTVYFDDSAFVGWAVGVLLVEESGGIVTDWWGRGPDIYERTGCIIAANRATHAYLIDKLKDAPMKDPVPGGHVT